MKPRKSQVPDYRGDTGEIAMGSPGHFKTLVQQAFQNWKKGWEWRVLSGKEYFEGDRFS